MKRTFLFITCAITVLLTAACDLIGLPVLTPIPTATIDQQALLEQSIAATMAANTQIAEAVQPLPCSPSPCPHPNRGGEERGRADRLRCFRTSCAKDDQA